MRLNALLEDKVHPGWKLSRECICDTLLAKRDGVLSQPGLARSLYCHNIRALRDTQLAPRTQLWHVGRILDMQTAKRAASDIVIVLCGGVVEKVLSTNPYTKIYVADYGENRDDAELDDAEECGNAPDMHRVYPKMRSMQT